MSGNQYDVSEEIQRLFKIKQKRREEARNYFRKILTNPYRPFGEGYPFDPVMHRFNSLTAYEVEHFKPSPKTITFGLAFMILPLLAIYHGVKYERQCREKKYRAGKVKYEDRPNKLIL